MCKVPEDSEYFYTYSSAEKKKKKERDREGGGLQSEDYRLKTIFCSQIKPFGQQLIIHIICQPR